jgi:hypothetical protein
MATNPFRPNTKRWTITELCNSGNTRRETFNILKPEVLAQNHPMIFSANVNGRRQAKPIGVQLVELKNEVNRVFSLMGKMDNDPDFDNSNPEDDLPDTATVEDDPKPDAEPDAIEDEPEPDAKPVKKKSHVQTELEFFFSEWKRLRRWCEERAAMADPIDSLSMRPVLAAKAGIPRGIPAKALLAAMAMHWAEDVKVSAGIEGFDYLSISEDLGENFHPLAGYAVKLAEARIPIMLIGPAGSGKSHVAKQIADKLDLPYGETPMTAGATPSWLLGRWTMQGFSTSHFLEIYANGGVFNFEEIDAADPNMLLVCNNALASDALFNPVNGEVYNKSPNFIPVSTANTFGLGANREYTGRERLDAATIDRWRMGRIEVPVSEKLAETILYS